MVGFLLHTRTYGRPIINVLKRMTKTETVTMITLACKPDQIFKISFTESDITR